MNYRILLLFFIFLVDSTFPINGYAGERSTSFYHSYNCLNKCLEQIPGKGRIFYIVLKQLHDTIQDELVKESLSIEDLTKGGHNRHRVVDFFMRNHDLLDLTDAQRSIIASIQSHLTDNYNSLSEECEKEIQNLTPVNLDDQLSDMTGFINGNIPFSVKGFLKSKSMKFRIENAISKGLSTHIDNVSYDPKNMRFLIRVDKDGNFLPNEAWLDKVEKIIEYKKRINLPLTDKERRYDDQAAYILSGTIGVLPINQQCKVLTDEYCSATVITMMKKIDVETGQVISQADQISVNPEIPIYVSSNLNVDNIDELKIGNINQIYNIEKYIRYSACLIRPDLNKIEWQSRKSLLLACDPPVIELPVRRDLVVR